MQVNVSFSIRRQEFFIPAAIVLKALIECSDREVRGGGGTRPGLRGERAGLACGPPRGGKGVSEGVMACKWAQRRWRGGRVARF